MKHHHPYNATDKNDPAHGLYQAIASIKTAAEAQQLLEDLCTPAEIQAMADRWRVIDLIKQGRSYREIYAITGVSVTTIGRVARCIMYGTGGYDLIYGRVSKLVGKR